MPFSLDFKDVVEYDVGQPGITVQISLKLDRQSIPVEAKLDTGSTDCIFSRSIGEQLGLIIEDGRDTYISTATSRFRAYLHGVTISILDYEFEAYVYFAEDENFNRNVLGRFGFLDRLILGLVDYEGKLYLNRYEDLEK